MDDINEMIRRNRNETIAGVALGVVLFISLGAMILSVKIGIDMTGSTRKLESQISDLQTKIEEIETVKAEEAVVEVVEEKEVVGPRDYTNIGEPIDLKECPLCHSSNVALLSHSKDYYIRCEDCWLFTIDWDDKDALISYWNNR